MRKTYAAIACALALLMTMPSASAARLDGVAVHYSPLNDAGDVDIADLTLSIAPESPPWPLTWLGDNIRYDLTVGQFFHGDGRNRHVSFVYAGPTWQYRPDFLWRGGFLEFGTALTFLEHGRVGDHNLGGHLFFTTHVTVGHRFGSAQQWQVGLRFQHTSNAGTRHPNPGLDAGLVELAYRFR